mgnify:CR=1 FL=1
MIRTRLSLFQSRLRYTHVMPHDIKPPDVDSGRTKAPFTASRQRPPREETALEEMVSKLRKEQIVEPADPTEYNADPLVLSKPDGS